MRKCENLKIISNFLLIQYNCFILISISYERPGDIPKGISFNEMSRNLHKIRNKVLPKSPNNVEEINSIFENENILMEYGYTSRKDVEDQTVFFRTAQAYNGFSYCVFASADIVEAIKANISPGNRTYYVDGTFKITPIGAFVQVLILSIDFMGQVNEIYTFCVCVYLLIFLLSFLI